MASLGLSGLSDASDRPSIFGGVGSGLSSVWGWLPSWDLRSWIMFVALSIGGVIFIYKLLKGGA